MNAAVQGPADEAKQVIETETRCANAVAKEPTFLVATRYKLRMFLSDSTRNGHFQLPDII